MSRDVLLVLLGCLTGCAGNVTTAKHDDATLPMTGRQTEHREWVTRVVERVTVTSEPVGAEVYLDGERVGTTPATFDVVHERVTIRQAGFYDVQIRKRVEVVDEEAERERREEEEQALREGRAHLSEAPERKMGIVDLREPRRVGTPTEWSNRLTAMGATPRVVRVVHPALGTRGQPLMLDERDAALRQALRDAAVFGQHAAMPERIEVARRLHVASEVTVKSD